jgi:hypothetical protein
LIPAPLATVPVSRASRPSAPPAQYIAKFLHPAAIDLETGKTRMIELLNSLGANEAVEKANAGRDKRLRASPASSCEDVLRLLLGYAFADSLNDVFLADPPAPCRPSRATAPKAAGSA